MYSIFMPNIDEKTEEKDLEHFTFGNMTCSLITEGQDYAAIYTISS